MNESSNLSDASHNAFLPLQVKSLCYSVEHRSLIRNLNLRVQSPGLSVIIGPNGAGKSIFLRLLHGLLAPSSGSIHWGEQEAGEEVRQRQSLVFQKPVLLRRSVRSNIEFVKSLPQNLGVDMQTDHLLSLVGLQAKADQLARSLSGGEQQRLALARALVTKPDVLLLDEPSASLDPGSVGLIEKIVKDQNRLGVKVIFVTHDLGQARRLADDVIFMHRGEVIENTAAAVFFEKPVSPLAQDYLSGKLIV